MKLRYSMLLYVIVFILLASFTSAADIPILMRNDVAVIDADRYSVGDSGGTEYGSSITIMNTSELTINNSFIEVPVGNKQGAPTDVEVCVVSTTGLNHTPVFALKLACGTGAPAGASNVKVNFTMNGTFVMDAGVYYAITVSTVGANGANARYLGGLDNGPANTWEHDFWIFSGVAHQAPTAYANQSAGNNIQFRMYGDLLLPVPDTLNITLDTPANDSLYVTDLARELTFNATVNSTFNMNCSLYVNNTLNYTTEYSSGLDVPIEFAANFTPNLYTWNIWCNNTNTTENSTTRTFEVITLMIDNCTKYNMTAMNFTMFNESDDTVVRGDIDGWFNVTIGNDYVEFNLTWVNVTSGNICIYPNWTSYYTDAQIEYSADGFNTETHYLTNATLDNTTEYINLFFTDDGTAVTFTVTDQDDNVVENVYIHVLSYDFGTNSHQTSEILKTDSQGQAIGNIKLNTQWYKFLLIYQGTTYLETEPVKITTTSRNFRINLQSNFFDFFDTFDNVETSLTYTNATLNYAYTFVNTLGTSVTACLKVIERSSTTDTLINDTCVTAVSGTILVNVNGTGAGIDDKTFIGTGRLELNPTEITHILETYFGVRLFERFGKDGIFATFFIRLTLAMIGIWSPMVAIIFLLLADITMISMGIYGMSWIVLMFYIILGGLAIYRVGRK